MGDSGLHTEVETKLRREDGRVGKVIVRQIERVEEGVQNTEENGMLYLFKRKWL